jgi:hypothetical protein
MNADERRFQAGVLELLEQWRERRSAHAGAFERWLAEFSGVYGRRFLEPEENQSKALAAYYGLAQSADFHELLFAVHTYFAQLIRSALEDAGVRGSRGGAMFAWCGDWRIPPPGSASLDRFKPAYQSLVPRSVRHALGEYYTPDWLADLLLDEIGYDGDADRRLLDPACGSGAFLVLAIDRARKRGVSPAEIPRAIHGFELNPLAALAARANYALALGGDVPWDTIPVFRKDAILEAAPAEPFDFVAGNPPWVRWDYLPEDYRRATTPLWKRYGLFTLPGFDARLGGGKKDLSMLFTYVSADRYLKNGGTLGFLITQEVMKAKGAAEGFRRFRLGEDGPPLRVVKAHDFVKLHPFDGSGNKTAAILLSKGEETSYPVPYVVWSREGGSLRRTELHAEPVGSPHGPWRTAGSDEQRRFPLCPASPYKAMLGANANPYGVFWLEVLEVLPDGLARVRNLPERGKLPIAVLEARIETDLIYPALRGSDIGRWAATPGVHVLVVQDPETRRGYDETAMRVKWPRTLEYLRQFREILLARALYRKYHREQDHPFWSQFNVAPETFARHKVVWKRMSNDLCAAVFSDWAGPLGRKTVVPLETTSFLAASGEDEAHYLCAVLNSPPVREFVRSFSAAGRGFGTPTILRHIGIPQFNPANEAHQALAASSRARREVSADLVHGSMRQ